jgi:hypothetical protein
VAIDEVHGAIGRSGPGKGWDRFDYIPKLLFQIPQLLDTRSIQHPQQSQENGHRPDDFNA